MPEGLFSLALKEIPVLDIKLVMGMFSSPLEKVRLLAEWLQVINFIKR